MDDDIHPLGSESAGDGGSDSPAPPGNKCCMLRAVISHVSPFACHDRYGHPVRSEVFPDTLIHFINGQGFIGWEQFEPIDAAESVFCIFAYDRLRRIHHAQEHADPLPLAALEGRIINALLDISLDKLLNARRKAVRILRIAADLPSRQSPDTDYTHAQNYP